MKLSIPAPAPCAVGCPGWSYWGGDVAFLILSLWGSPKAGVYSEQLWGAEGTGPEPTVDEGMAGGGGGVRALSFEEPKS